MNIIVGKYSGFCSGVNYTVSKANEEVLKNQPLYCLGEIVHNERVIEDLEKKGMITVSNLSEIPNNNTVIFRAHGESQNTYQFAHEKNLNIIDLTCGKIRIIKKKIEKEIPNSFIVIIGKKNHPETIGTLSFSGPYSHVMENQEDKEEILSKIQNSPFHRVYVVAQTTFSSSKFDELSSLLQEKCPYEVIVDKTICDATEKRQNEVRELSKIVDKMIIIGGKNSSNTKELYQIALESLKNVFFIQNSEDLDIQFFSKNDTIGIMAGASTPDIILEEVKKRLYEIS